MANSSNRIIDRYKSYITKSQRKNLQGMYPGYRQTTADELREQYLDNRRSMGRTGAVASAYGLGEGYIARKQADLDRVTDRYALQLGQQADSSFERQVVDQANQTIKARNEAARKAYERKLAAARKKQAENDAAYKKYLRDKAAYEKALKEYNRQQKQNKNALRSGGAAKSINTANALEAWDAAHGEYYDPRFGRAGVYGSSGNVYSMPKAATPRNAWYEYYDPRFGRTGNYGSPDYGSAAPKQEDVVKRKKQAVMGTVTKPVFTVNPKVKMPVEPKMQKFIDAQVAEIEANPPAEIEKLKLNLTQEYERATSEYKDVLDATQFEASYGAQAQQLMARYKELEQMATDTRYTPEQRRDYARTMQGIQQQYAQLTSYFKANVPHIHRSMEDLNRRYSELQVKRGVLAALGVTLDDQTLALNGSWLRQGNAIPTVQDRRFWEHAQDVSVAFDDNGKVASVIYNKPGTKEWFDENGYADFVKTITDSYTLSPEEIGGKDNIKTLSELADYNDAIKSNPEAAKEYLRRREYQSVLQEARMHPNEFREAVAVGEAKTGLSKGLEYGRKHIANHETTAADIVASPFGMDKKNYFTSSLEKKLDLPKGYLSGNIYKVMTDEDIAFINYCYGTGNEQAAKEYLYELTEWGNSVAAEKRASKITGSENAPEAIKAIREFLWQTGFGAGSLSSNVQDIFASEARPTSEAEATASRITQGKVERGWSPFWASTVDSAAQSFGNNAASALVGAAFGGAGSKLASVTMGLSAAGQAKMETLRQGYGDGAATVYGILNGVSEAVLQEKVGGLVGFGDRGVFTKVFANAVNTIDSPVLRTLINQGLDILSEIGEEEFGNIVDNINRSVALGEKRGLFDGFAEQAGETAVSTAISTILLNALHIPAQIRNERGYSSIAKASGMSLKDAKLLLETDAAIKSGDKVDPKDLSRYNELTAVLTAAMPENVAKAIAEGKMTVADWVTSNEGVVQGKLTGKLTKDERTAVQTEAVDHTEALKGKTDEQRRDYLLNATPTGKVGSAYYTTADGKAIQFRNLNTTQKANYVLAQKCAKAFEGSVDVVIHDTLPLSNGAMVGSDGKLHIALDTTNEQGRESIAYWTLAHEAGHALKIADSKAWGEMFDVLTDYAKNHKDRDGKSLYDALVDSITNQYKYDNDSDAFNDEMFSLIAERMVGSEGEQWAATLGDNTIFDAIAADKNASAKAKKGFLGKLKTSVEKLSRQFRDGGFSKERKRLAKIREQLTEAYKRINEGDSAREKYAEQSAQRRKETPAITRKVEVREGENLVAEKGVEGKAGTVRYGAGNKLTLKFHYAAVNVNDLVTSHTLDGSINDAYPAELQPRDRSRASSQQQILDIGNDIIPEKLGAYPGVQEGAPIIGQDMVVESGNGRTIALRYAAKNGKLKGYTAWLKEHASEYGFKAENIKPNTVLVRVRDSEVNRADFAKEANKTTIATMNATERAQTDADALESILNKYRFTEGADFNSSANSDFFSAFVDKVAGVNEANALLTSKGTLSNEGVTRIQNALFELAYHDKTLTEQFTEGDENPLRNIIKAMLNVAPVVAKTTADIAKGDFYDVNFASDFVTAERFLKDLKTNPDMDGLRKAEAYYEAYPSNLVEENPEYLKKLEIAIDNNLRSQRSLSYLLNRIIEGVQRLGSPNQLDMFGGMVDTSTAKAVNELKEQIVDRAVDALEKQKEEWANSTRFQMKAPVETTDRLIAWHNMSEDALRSALELGGLAMPSWAIKTADKAHTSYGDISVIAPRALVDPKQNRNSRIFGGDAWTPVFPNVDYKISRDAAEALEGEIGNLIGNDLLHEFGGAALDADNIADQFNRNGGAVSSYYKNNVALRYAFLKSIGQEVEIPKRSETLDSTGNLQNGAIVRFANSLVSGKLSLQPYLEMPGTELMKQDDLLEAVSRAILSEYEETLPPKIYKDLAEVYSPSEIKYSEVDHMLRAAKKYFERGIKQVADKNALIKRIDEAIDEAAYEKWIGDKLKATIERKGIRNNKDMFTPAGNRRSFDALHYEYTLANIVKAMKSQPKQGRTQFLSGPGSVKGAALKSYNTVEQVRADRGRLVNTAEEAEAAYKEYSQNLESILDRMGKDLFSSADALIEVLQHAKTEDGIYRYMERKLKGWYNVSKDIAHDIYELIGEINALPMEYFEGKTYDAVTFDETAAVVVPDNTSEELKQQLADAGANVVEYKAGDNDDRLEKVNSVEGVRFQHRATDTEYLSLAEKYRDGTASAEDINALNKAVEEAARKAGYTYRGWHGTANNFTVFDKRRAGQNWGGDSRLGPGFYFAHDQNTASKWTDGTRVVDAFLSMQKPLDLRKEVPDDISRAIDKKFDDRMGKYESWYPVSKEQFRENIERLRENEKRNPAEFLDSFKYDSEGKMTDGIHEMLSDLGYDGIISDDEIVVFSPSQIKSADPVTYDDNGDIIPLSERFNAENEDIRYQQRDFRIDFNVPQLDTKALHEAVKGGEGTVENRFEVKYEKTDAGFAVHITDKDSGKTYDRAETVTEGNAKAEAERAAAAVIRNIKRGKPDSTSKSAAGIYIEPGANAARSSAVPVSYEDESGNIRRNSKVARTMIEAGWMTDEQAERFADQVHDGIMSYEPVTNAEAKAYAEGKVSEHPAAAQAEWEAMYNSFAIPSDKDLAVGYQLMANAANDGDFDMMLKLGTELREMMTKAGQAIQSMNLLKQMGAVADVYRIDKAVQKMNDDLMKAAKGYFISVNPDLVEALLKTKPDTQEYNKALEALYKDIASQIKPSLSDALTEYRYLAMLGNPRTHIRNLVGNAVFMPAVAMKNVFGTIFEGIRYGGNSAMKTKALAYGKQYGQFAKEDWGKVKTTIKSTGNKYRDMMSDIDNYRNHFGKGLGWLDKVAKFNSKMLEGEDMLFKQAYYRTALAAELSAKKVNLNDLRAAIEARDSGAKMQKDSAEFRLLSLYEEARARAIKEANVNTYNDANKFARDLNAFSRGGGKLRHMMVEGLLPFKNTPANIVSRSIEYSPVGLINSVTREAVKLHKGEIGANEFFDKIARGFSGSAIFALGVWLAKAGVLVGPLGDDKEDKEKKRRGRQAFSVEIAGKSYTLDWMAPVCIPLFTGVALYEMLEKDGNGEHWSQYAMNALTGMLEPITKMSMLEGIENLIDSLAYSDSKLEDAAITVGTSYLTQFIPTLSGQIARTIDPYTRRTYSDKESMLPRLVDKFVQTVQKKIPKWNQSLQPYVNELGEVEKEDNPWLRIFDNFISPGFRSAISNTKLDKELERLGDPSIYPSAASKSFTYNKATYNLRADEYTAFATARGTTAGTLMNSLIDSKAYQGLTDLDQVKAQAKAIEYANAIAKAGILNMRGILDSDIDWDALGSWVPKANEYAKLSDSPTALADYIAIKTYTDGMKADGSSRFGNVADYTVTNKDGTTSVKWNDMKYDYLQSLNLSDKERLFLADAFGIKQDAYGKAEAAVAEVPNLTIDAYTKALDHWQDLTVEKNQKKESLSEAEYEKWLAGNTNAFKKYLNDTKELSGQQKFALLTKIGSSEGWEGKANDLHSNYGVGYDDAWRAAYKASTLTSTDEASKNAQYMAYLNTTKLGAKQKFGLYGAFGTSTSSLVEKATAFATGGKYNNGKNSAAAYGKPSYDALWNAYTAYNGGVQHEAFYDWLSKQSGMNAQQRFACCEFTNSQSAWLEKAVDVHAKMGISYDTLWKIKVYWRGESGKGKKERITAYCKKLGLKQSQIDKLYDEYKFLS